MYPISKPPNTKRIPSVEAHWVNSAYRLSLLFNHLVECRVSLNAVHQFINEDQIWPDQIQDTILTFRKIQTTTEKIPSLLSMENQSYLRNKVDRYQIIVNSEFLHNQINEAIDMISSLESRNKSSIKTTQKNIKYTLAQIKSNLDELLEDLGEIRA